MKPCHSLVLALALAAAGGAHAQQRAQHPCGSLANAYGPFDYRIYKDRIEVLRVDEHHFTPLVENLIKPMFQYFAADFDYTLRAVPNHHRALMSMARHSLKVKDVQPPGAGRTVDCYFDRAMRFTPDDMVVRMIYADYMLKLGNRRAEAVAMLDFVGRQAGENAFTHYNLGMLYFEAGENTKASRHAQEALNLGLARTELKDRIVAAGKWVEPPATTAPAAAASSASAPAAEATADKASAVARQ